MCTRQVDSPSGFSLIEVLVASGMLAGALLTMSQLFATAVASTAEARATSEAATLAWQKLDELRSYAFGSDDAGAPVTDAALHGLAGSLDRDTAGYVDYVDALSEPVGNGPPAPAGTRYRRRWAIDAANPDLLVLRVRVLPNGRDVDLASVAALRARKAP